MIPRLCAATLIAVSIALAIDAGALDTYLLGAACAITAIVMCVAWDVERRQR